MAKSQDDKVQQKPPTELLQEFLEENNLMLEIGRLTTKNVDNGGVIIEHSGIVVRRKDG